MGLTSSRHEGTIGAKKKGVKFFFNFFFGGVWGRGCGVWARGCGVWGVGCGGVWVWGGGIGMGRAGWRRDRDGAGCGLLDGTASRAPRASPSRIRIAGSGVIDRPTFRIPGSQMRACLGCEKSRTSPPPTHHKMVGMPLGLRRSL